MPITLLKKGQSEMMETFMVIIVIVILLIVGLFFYYSFAIEGYTAEGEETAEESGIALMSAISSMPEITCANKDNCVDITKVFAFKKILETNPREYTRFFKGKTVRINIIYPEPQVTDKECTLQEFQQTDFPENCDWIRLFPPTEELAKAREEEYRRTIIAGTATSIYLPYKERFLLGRIEVIIGIP